MQRTQLVLCVIRSVEFYICLFPAYCINNLISQDNWTALLCAAKEGHTDVCLELLEHGADLEHRDMVRSLIL